MECSICRKIKNEKDRKLHLITDDHIKRVVEPYIWNRADEIDDEIEQIDSDENISSKEKIKLINKLKLEKKSLFGKEKVKNLDVEYKKLIET